MPLPNSTESREDYISNFMSDKNMQKKHPDKKQRLTIAYLHWKKESKKDKKDSKEILNTPEHMFRFASKGMVSFKEDGDLIVKGYVATTHYDGQDTILKDALDNWAKEINEGSPRVNKVSIHHDRQPKVVGVGIKGSARVDQFNDGEFGLYVDTLVNKTIGDFDNIKYEIEHDILDSFSIEYTASEDALEYDGVRILDEDTQLYGWTLASRPMNEHAVMIKELIISSDNETKKQINKEEITMPEDIKKETVIPEEETETKEVKVETKEIKGKELSETEYSEYTKFKEMQTKANRDKEYNMMKEAIAKEIETKLTSKLVDTKGLINKGNNIESKEFINYKEILTKDSADKISLKEQINRAVKIAESKGLINGTRISATSRDSLASKGFSVMDIQKNGEHARGIMQFKALGITTNQNTDTDYLLSAAELNDIFDPVFYNALNQSTVTWNILAKEDRGMKGNNMIQFRLETAEGGTATAYTGNAVTTGNATRIKYETKFKKYQAGVEVDGDMIAAARGSVGDVFALEVDSAMRELMSRMNKDLFLTNGLETASQVIGFDYYINTGTYTTLYNVTRSATNKLAPDSSSDNYVDMSSSAISKSNLRKVIRHCVVDGSEKNNLVIICNPIQEDKIKELYEDQGRLVLPTSTRFGFEGRLSFDGVPIFTDKDASSSTIYVIDLFHMRIGIWVPPTLEMLGKDADSQKGFIKTYWCTYNTAPRRCAMVYDCAIV